MLRKVKLYGLLGERYGKEWELNVNDGAEAIRAICANRPGFKKELLTSHERGVGYQVLIGDEYLKDANDLPDTIGNEEIKIIPTVMGAKKKGLMQIIIGAIMIYAAFQTGGMLGAGQVAAPGYSTIGGYAFSSSGMMMLKFGASLVLGGIGAMLAPTPTVEKRPEEPENYAFNGPVNTTRQGVAVPICYGQLIVGGAVISAGIIAEDYTPE